MGAFSKLFSPLWSFVGRQSYLCALICLACAGLAAFAHQGHLIALFTCMASMIVMWKVEADHPIPAI
jgi:hypothetical protein